jgi:hypothetical protein
MDEKPVEVAQAEQETLETLISEAIKIGWREGIAGHDLVPDALGVQLKILVILAAMRGERDELKKQIDELKRDRYMVVHVDEDGLSSRFDAVERVAELEDVLVDMKAERTAAENNTRIMRECLEYVRQRIDIEYRLCKRQGVSVGWVLEWGKKIEAALTEIDGEPPVHWEHEDNMIVTITEGMFYASRLRDGVRMYPYRYLQDVRSYMTEDRPPPCKKCNGTGMIAFDATSTMERCPDCNYWKNTRRGEPSEF